MAHTISKEAITGCRCRPPGNGRSRRHVVGVTMENSPCVDGHSGGDTPEFYGIGLNLAAVGFLLAIFCWSQPARSETLTTTCRFDRGPRAGTLYDFTPFGADPIQIGLPCHDGQGSSGVAVAGQGQGNRDQLNDRQVNRGPLGQSQQDDQDRLNPGSLQPGMTLTCRFTQGPIRGQIRNFQGIPGAVATTVGSSCFDGEGSEGIAIAPREQAAGSSPARPRVQPVDGPQGMSPVDSPVGHVFTTSLNGAASAAKLNQGLIVGVSDFFDAPPRLFANQTDARDRFSQVAFDGVLRGARVAGMIAVMSDGQSGGTGFLMFDQPNQVQQTMPLMMRAAQQAVQGTR